ncbi:hypothetical protein COLO4_25183 [Corchorus olitorius]|uniref:Uncharacterized protein n=1 Tax=Corchorus olitorius TaxID=93759 RepID=A0A1R3I4C9_9ROSI|nr:hypothetical protein COLO4_25183 [Corchorus olitorius]
MVPLPMTNNFDQNQKTNTPTPSDNNNIPQVPILLPAIAYFYLTFNSISTIYQAYSHGDFSMVAFIVFVYLGYFCLIYCVKQLQALSPLENSPRKDLLKSVIWVLTSFIFFGFAYQFSTFVHPVAAVFVFALAISATSFLFFMYFVHDDDYGLHQQKQVCSGSTYRLKIKIVGFSLPCGRVNESKISQVVAGPENV